MLILLPLYFWLYCKSTANPTTIIFNCSIIFNYYHIQLLLHICIHYTLNFIPLHIQLAVQSSDKFTYLLGLAKLCLPCDWQSSIASLSLPLYMKTSLLLQWIRISEALLNRGHARGSKITLTLWIETLWLLPYHTYLPILTPIFFTSILLISLLILVGCVLFHFPVYMYSYYCQYVLMITSM